MGGVGEEVYRLSLERGSFLAPLKTGASSVNALAVDPAKARTCSDCVWFSRSPPPSLLTHMMNPVDGAAFKIDLGLSMPTV